MDTREELLGQARKSGKLPENERERDAQETEAPEQRSDGPAIPYGNPGRPKEPPADEPDVSSFA